MAFLENIKNSLKSYDIKRIRQMLKNVDDLIDMVPTVSNDTPTDKIDGSVWFELKETSDESVAGDETNVLASTELDCSVCAETPEYSTVESSSDDTEYKIANDSTKQT